jgi:hypothetical protein
MPEHHHRIGYRYTEAGIVIVPKAGGLKDIQAAQKFIYAMLEEEGLDGFVRANYPTETAHRDYDVEGY